MTTEPRPGEVLDDRYRLVERLGRGGFGDVWRAEELLPDETPLRQVALKLLRGHAVSHDWSAEARIIASLRHPALVTIYAAGLLATDGRRLPFVAMELLEGDNLATFVGRHEVVPWRRVLAWAREAAAALDEIHRAGVVHLDLKPANLFLSEGRVKVLDFGIARHGVEPAAPLPTPEPLDEMSTAAFMAAQGDAPSAASTSRSVVGTPGFMAPEIFEEGEATHASDAYALAACIVQLATGKLPQHVADRPTAPQTASTTMQVWLSQVQEATLRGAIRDLRADAARLPEGLVALVEQWLALDPAARGVARGGMRAALDAVWERPHGLPDRPYRGLSPYRSRDEGAFFGRAADAARIARELVDAPCAVLQGDAGIGLQSLALAGVVPALAKRFADGRHDWRCCELTLERAPDPDARVRGAIATFLADHGAARAGDEVQALDAWAAEAEIGAVVVIDDLHQLVARSDEAPLLEALVSALAEGRPGLRLVGTLRSEHSAAFLDSPLGRRLKPWVRFIGPLGADAVDELVRRPADDAGREIEGAAAIVDDLQAELAADGARLPLVSLALTAWWQGDLTLAAWREGGAVIGRLAAHAERVVAELEDPSLAEDLLVRLVAADGSLVERDEADLREVAEVGPEVVETLLGARLVERRAGRLRLSHPRLADHWRRLDERRLHDIERLEFLADLDAATHRWTLAARPRRLLWRGDQLGRARRWHDRVAREIDEDARGFLAASLAARRLAWGLRGVVMACLVAMIAGGIWLDREQEREAAAQAERLERARLDGALASMVSRARRVDDPYLKVALLTGAIGAGANDPTLPLELGAAARDLPSTTFLSLDRVAFPDFHWGPRWLVGGVGREVVVYDFDPPAGPDFAPVSHRFAPHDRGLADLVPFAFDTSFVTRSVDGELKVWRLREDGTIALAARSPMRCQRGLSQVIVATAAPVIACSTEDGLARWDLRAPTKVAIDPFRGRALHVSDDGRWLAAVWLGQVLLWSADERHVIDVDHPPAAGRFSPRDRAIALVWPGAVDVYALAGEPAKIFSLSTTFPDPVDARWDDSGLYLAVCDFVGGGRFHYLRPGGRHPDDPPPPDDPHPCEHRRHPWPAPLRHTRDYGETLTQRQIGPRVFEGGWRLEDGRMITRDLAVFEPEDGSERELLRFEAKKPAFEHGLSSQGVIADGDRVIWQVGDQVRVLDRRGEELMRARGHLLARCPDARLLSYRKSDDGSHWELFDARHDVLLRRVIRTPGFVLGADPTCARVWFQSHEGALGSVVVEGDHRPVAYEELAVPGGAYAFDGYVFDARPSAGPTPGLWLAGSSGALARVTADGGLVAYGAANPRATMIADGPTPGDLVFADETGVVLRPEHGQDRVLLRRQSDRTWEDAMAIDDQHLLLAWAHGVAVVDGRRGEIVGNVKTPWRGRLARWDEAGSVIVWPFAFMGEPRGEIIPFSRELATRVGARASNLRARLAPDKHIVIGLD